MPFPQVRSRSAALAKPNYAEPRSGSAQIKTVTVPDLDVLHVLHACEALSQADDLIELCGRWVWRPGSTATPMNRNAGPVTMARKTGRMALLWPCPGRLRFDARFASGSSSWGISY